MTIQKEDEMQSLITGLNFLLRNIPNESFTYSTKQHDPDPKHYVPVGVRTNGRLMFADVSPQDDPFPYLLVNIGSGVRLIDCGVS